MKNLLTACVLLSLVACTTLYTSTVTITKVVDSGMKSWAQASVNGQSTAAIDAAVVKAHNQYRSACAVAKTALENYKAGGNVNDYTTALTAVRASVDDLFALITPLITSAEATKLQTDLQKASSL